MAAAVSEAAAVDAAVNAFARQGALTSMGAKLTRIEPGFDLRTWRTPPARLVSLMSDADRAKAAEVEKEAKVIEDARLKQQEEFINEVLEKELLKRPEELRAPLREAYKTVVAKRTPAQVKLLKEHPTVMQLSPGSLYLYEQKKADELKKQTDEAAKIREKKPAEEFIPVFNEVVAAGAKPDPAPTFLFHRGDPDQPKQTLKPGDLTILDALRPVDLPEKNAALPTTGRRLAYARALTDGTHPLTTRVLVNRVWLHQFGEGIVRTPNDFGLRADPPTHPELLDYLAWQFMEGGWSVKRLQKLILLSHAWQQSSDDVPRFAQVDPENRWLWQQNRRRLEFEALRDTVLHIGGKLNFKMGGPGERLDRPDSDGEYSDRRSV